MNQPIEGFQIIVATITVNICEKEYHASIVRPAPSDGDKYFLMSQKWHQYHPFHAPNDDEATAHGMALMGQILKQELVERRQALYESTK